MDTGKFVGEGYRAILPLLTNLVMSLMYVLRLRKKVVRSQ